MERAETTFGRVLDHIFTNPNPSTKSPPPEHVAWAIFAEGTIFYTFPNDELPVDASPERIAAAARTALQELGPVLAGTPSADFNPVLLSAWFPHEHVFFVTYDHPAIATIVLADAPEALPAGLAGRIARDADLESLELIEIRDFHGRTHPPVPTFDNSQ